MVASVSPSCAGIADNSDNSSSLSLQAMAFAAAVIEAVSSHAFIISDLSFFIPYIICWNTQKDSPDGFEAVLIIDNTSYSIQSRTVWISLM